MKKRLLCALMAMMMLFSLVPAAALSASAASFTTSNAAIGMLKEFEGYSKYCKWDNAQWSVGYGTACNGANHPDTKVNGTLGGHAITEVDAIADLREELEAVEKAVNSFAASSGIALSQNKFDALVLFSYNCGTAWMRGSGTFKQAIVKGTTGNEFLYAISLWSASGGEILPGLVSRRLAEANLYLNGEYSVSRPANYTYVRFDGNGAVPSDKVQGYATGSYVAIKASAAQTGKTFMGWYTAAEGGEWVRSLTAAVGTKTLYAHWQDAAAPAPSDVSYKMAANSFTSLQPLSVPSADGKAHGSKLAATDTVQIVQDFVDANGDKWCRVSGSGWLKVGPLVTEDGATPADVVVTVTNSYINVRKNPGTAPTNAVIGKVNQGDKLTITAVKVVNGALWGQFEKGWVALMYTNYDSVIESAPEVEEDQKEETVPEDAIATAVVNCSTYVNVRKGAGMQYGTCGSLANGTQVTLFEIATVNGHEWGKISTGWFCLDYAIVTMLETEDSDKEETDKEETDKEEQPEDENAEKPIATGNVVCSTSVNLRSGAGVTNAKVGSLTNGSVVKIYEITTVIGHKWGRIGEGVWICLDYVKYTMVETETEGEGGEGSAPEQETVVSMFSGTVSGDTLNIRKEAKASADKLGAYTKGDKVYISEVVSGTKANGDAAVWGKVTVTVDKKEVSGWICLTGLVTLDPVNYEVISNTLNVREGVGTSFDKVDKLSKGTVVAISELGFAGENLWGYSKLFEGWMNITSTYMKRTDGFVSDKNESTDTEDTPSTPNNPTTPNNPVISNIAGKAVVTGLVKLNVRSGAGMSYGTVGQLASGTEVTVYETLLSGGMSWGRIGEGQWICLSYTMFTSTGVSGKGQMATVVNTYTGVNIRGTASTNGALLGKILVNSRVEILEVKSVNGKNWGRTVLGWVSMDYILLDSDAGVNMDDILNGNIGTTPGTPENDANNGGTAVIEPTALASYKATAAAATAVYKEAGSKLIVGVELAAGEDITVYELATVKAADKTETYWARVDEGWILASNVALKDIKETYTVITNKLNIRKDAGANNEDIGDLLKGDVVEVSKLKIVKASIWGYVAAKEGWINTSTQYVTLGKVDLNTSTTPSTPDTPSTDSSTSTGTGSTATGEVLYTGTVVRTGKTKLAIRQAPATSGKELGRLADGTSVKIYEVAIAEYMAWGKTDSGWICLTYVDLQSTKTDAVDARVIWRDGLSIRSGAGTGNELVGSYAKATVVDIYEFSGNWGRTAEGWVCLDYLLP